ncbi:MAG TPA: alpha/beta fold hydrolase [Ilumatobacteraceae bacterium]
MPIETVMLDALDGVRLQADLDRVEGGWGSVVLTHPHPLYGGDRFSPVVDSLFRALPAAGFNVIRFDFRGVNESSGEHDNGDSERLDVLAAIELLEVVEPDAALWLVGYSFGAVVALNVVDPRVTGWIAIAPPLVGAAARCLAANDHRPKTIVVAAHDQFAPPDVVSPMVASWTATTMFTLDHADHFLNGRLAPMTDLVLAALTA